MKKIFAHGTILLNTSNESDWVIAMKIQEIQTNQGTRYLLLDNQFAIVDEVFRYLKYLDVSGKSPNTIRSYAYHLKVYYDYCMINGIDPLGVFKDSNRRPIDFFGKFILWLQYPDYSNGVIHYEKESPKRSNKTVNLIMTAVLSFYQYMSLNNELDEIDVYKFQRQQLSYKPMLFELMHHNIYAKKSLLKSQSHQKKLKQYLEANIWSCLNCVGLGGIVYCWHFFLKEV